MPDNISRLLVSNCLNLTQGDTGADGTGRSIQCSGVSIKMQFRPTTGHAPYFKLFKFPSLRLRFPARQQSVATPHAARGWARPPCRHFKTQSCFCAGSAFEVAAFQFSLSHSATSELPRHHVVAGGMDSERWEHLFPFAAVTAARLGKSACNWLTTENLICAVNARQTQNELYLLQRLAVVRSGAFSSTIHPLPSAHTRTHGWGKVGPCGWYWRCLSPSARQTEPRLHNSCALRGVLSLCQDGSSSHANCVPLPSHLTPT
jgi:hypothetical protein